MSARLIAAGLAALAVGACLVRVPLQPTPPQIDRPKAPLEVAGPQWASACADWDEWDKPGPPVRIHANSYYVGTCGISAILVTGTAGHVLIDSGTEAGADLIAANIRALGFRPEDVRILLHSHEHHDHVGGTARLQRLTGAQLVASAPAAKVFASGVPSSDDPQAGIIPPLAVAEVGRTIVDGETVRLGNLLLTAMATPGHTPGALSWRWNACDGGVCRTLVYADSLSPVSRDGYRFSDHPALVAAFRASFAKVAASECDILVTPHPSASQLRERFAGTRPMTDPGGCRAYAAALTQRLDQRLAQEAGPPRK